MRQQLQMKAECEKACTRCATKTGGRRLGRATVLRGPRTQPRSPSWQCSFQSPSGQSEGPYLLATGRDSCSGRWRLGRWWGWVHLQQRRSNMVVGAEMQRQGQQANEKKKPCCCQQSLHRKLPHQITWKQTKDQRKEQLISGHVNLPAIHTGSGAKLVSIR